MTAEDPRWRVVADAIANGTAPERLPGLAATTDRVLDALDTLAAEQDAALAAALAAARARRLDAERHSRRVTDAELGGER
jgi:hypothetical protein